VLLEPGSLEVWKLVVARAGSWKRAETRWERVLPTGAAAEGRGGESDVPTYLFWVLFTVYRLLTSFWRNIANTFLNSLCRETANKIDKEPKKNDKKPMDFLNCIKAFCIYLSRVS
jgi:hypothetical protein